MKFLNSVLSKPLALAGTPWNLGPPLLPPHRCRICKFDTFGPRKCAHSLVCSSGKPRMHTPERQMAGNSLSSRRPHMRRAGLLATGARRATIRSSCSAFIAEYGWWKYYEPLFTPPEFIRANDGACLSICIKTPLKRRQSGNGLWSFSAEMLNIFAQQLALKSGHFRVS